MCMCAYIFIDSLIILYCNFYDNHHLVIPTRARNWINLKSCAVQRHCLCGSSWLLVQIQHNGQLSGLADTLRRREDRTRRPLQWAHGVRAENIRAHRMATQVSTLVCVYVCVWPLLRTRQIIKFN